MYDIDIDRLDVESAVVGHEMGRTRRGEGEKKEEKVEKENEKEGKWRGEEEKKEVKEEEEEGTREEVTV